jgi:hypothetical protein
MGGMSSIYHQNNRGYYIYNLSKTYDGERYIAATVRAENNYWGSPYGLNAARYYGKVDASPYLSYEPGTGPLDMGEEPEDARQILSAAEIAVLSGSAKNEAEAQWLIESKQRALNLREQIKNKPKDMNTAAWLNELNAVLNAGPSLKALESERDHLNAFVQDYGKRLRKAKNPKPYLQLAGETAMLLEIGHREDSAEALRLAKRYDPYIQNADNRRELHLLRLSAYERQGEYEKAYKVLKKLKKLGGKDSFAPDYEPIETALNEELGLTVEETPLAGTLNHMGEAQLVETEVLPQEFALKANYPNPFNPQTKIPFHLPQASQVVIEVYNTLGQRIATPANGVFEAGRHKVVFNGASFASGLYIVRAQMKSKESGAAHHFVRKMILLK